MQLKYEGRNCWGQPVNKDQQCRYHRSADIRSIEDVEITHGDGSIDTINVIQNHSANITTI